MHFGNFFQLFNEPGSVIYKDARVISKAVKSKKMDLEAAKVSRDNRGTRGTRRITPKTKRYAAEVMIILKIKIIYMELIIKKYRIKKFLNEI